MTELLSFVLIISGLITFEIITSIDNAVINAEVLNTMSKRARRWFLTWGIFFSVFLIRGLLPWAIIWGTNPSLGPVGAWTAAFSDDPAVGKAIEMSAPPLLALGGMFLIFLFLHWLFLEPKNYGLAGERRIERQGVWFFAVVSVLLAVITWFAINKNPLMAFGAVMGSTIFFIVHGFRENAAKKEKEMMGRQSGLSDWSKILYLE